MKLLQLSGLLLFCVFLSACSLITRFVPQESSTSPDTAAPEVSPAEFIQNCQEEISKFENDVSKTDDFYEKAVLCKLAVDKAFRCIEEGYANFPNSPELPPIGGNYYHETTNYLCYCKNVIADKEVSLGSEQDPTKRYALLKEKIEFSMKCLQEFTNDFYEPNIAPKIGNDELGESSNIIKHCEQIIEDLKKQIDASSGEAKKALAEKMMEIEAECTQMWLSDLFDPEMAPQFGSDPYNTGDYYLILYSDAASESEDDSIPAAPDEDSTPETSKTDTCPEVMQYGYPVFDSDNLPSECKPSDNRDGWDCYTFEEPECEPSLRCFCIAPAEGMSSD